MFAYVIELFCCKSDEFVTLLKRYEPRSDLSLIRVHIHSVILNDKICFGEIENMQQM